MAHATDFNAKAAISNAVESTAQAMAAVKCSKAMAADRRASAAKCLEEAHRALQLAQRELGNGANQGVL